MLLLLNTDLTPNEDFEEWLNEDGFQNDPQKDSTKKYLLEELYKIKEEFRKDIRESDTIKDENGKSLSPVEVFNLIQGHKNRINKLRLVIEPEFTIGYHLNRSKNVRYAVARAYWINLKGKKQRQFSINLGLEEEINVHGKVPRYKKDEISKQFTDLMWDQYKSEYHNA